MQRARNATLLICDVGSPMTACDKHALPALRDDTASSLETSACHYRTQTLRLRLPRLLPTSPVASNHPRSTHGRCCDVPRHYCFAGLSFLLRLKLIAAHSTRLCRHERCNVLCGSADRSACGSCGLPRKIADRCRIACRVLPNEPHRRNGDAGRRRISELLCPD